MTTVVAFDVSGLAWRYRTGVQSLYWAYVNAWQRHPELGDRFDLRFYDRSGLYNRAVSTAAGAAYRSAAPRWWPTRMRRPLQALLRYTRLGQPDLQGAINHVWNWSIYNPPGGRASITIPDALPLEYPHWFDSRFQRLTQKSLDFASRDAEFVFAISSYVRKRVIALTGLKPERVRVAFPGIDSAYFNGVAQDVADLTLQRHGLTAGQYLLSSGFLDPRKNLVRQLRAFEVAVSNGAKTLKYALTGLKTSVSGDVLRIIDSPSLRDRVVFLGYVPQPELIALMSSSAALMYCSLAEGFGLPIIEAMAVGAPVITSATTSMQELAASRARLVNPEDVDDIASAIYETLHLPAEFQIARAQSNRTYAHRFTIANWLEDHLDAYSPGALLRQLENP